MSMPVPIPGSGDPLVADYLAFVAARARPNTLLAQAFDLRVFFAVVDVGVCEVIRMRTTVKIDDQLLAQAVELTGTT